MTEKVSDESIRRNRRVGLPPDRNSARQRRALRDEKGKLFHASEFSQWLMTEKVSEKSIKRLQ